MQRIRLFWIYIVSVVRTFLLRKYPDGNFGGKGSSAFDLLKRKAAALNHRFFISGILKNLLSREGTPLTGTAKILRVTFLFLLNTFLAGIEGKLRSF